MSSSHADTQLARWRAPKPITRVKTEDSKLNVAPGELLLGFLTKITGSQPAAAVSPYLLFSPTNDVRIIALACAALLSFSSQNEAATRKEITSAHAAPKALAAFRRPQDSQRYRLRTVVLDAGHGGKDIGCSGRSAHEADVALAIVRALGRDIAAGCPDVRVIYTRKTNVFIELDERAAIANRNHADLFISVHCNAGPRGSHGTEVWCMGPHKNSANLGVAKRENSVILQEKDYQRRYEGFNPNSPQGNILFSLFQSAYITNSLRLAQRVDKQFRTNVKRNSRGVKQAGFLVLWKSTMPSVLIESGFLTDPTEEKYLDTSSGQQAIANGIFHAFRAYKRELEGMPAE
jgi:N-acetylmuramoyl-L-alanine amidase